MRTNQWSDAGTGEGPRLFCPDSGEIIGRVLHIGRFTWSAEVNVPIGGLFGEAGRMDRVEIGMFTSSTLAARAIDEWWSRRLMESTQ